MLKERMVETGVDLFTLANVIFLLFVKKIKRIYLELLLDLGFFSSFNQTNTKGRVRLLRAG